MAKSSFQGDLPVVKTVGQVFADGCIIEPVASASRSGLALLFQNGTRKTIAPEIEYSGRVYRPPELDETMLRTIRFPHDAKLRGSTRKLFDRMRDLFARHAGLTQPVSALMTAWAASSWFADCLSSPPTLLISGPDMQHAITLFRLLHCMCRRPVVLGDLNRDAFLSLASLGATLLINQPQLSTKVRDLWSATNYLGVNILGRGKVCSAASSKAVFLGMAIARDYEGLRFALPPAPFDGSLLQERDQSEIADELQPQLLAYRLRNIDRVSNFSASKQGSMFVNTEIGRNLGASILCEATITELITPLLRRMQQEDTARHACDLHVALVEVAWAPSHQDREITVSHLTALTNTSLRCQGETLEYSPEEVGWKLLNLGFRRHRNGQGMVLRFSQENRVLLHQLAAQLGLKMGASADCALCPPLEDVVTQ